LAAQHEGLPPKGGFSTGSGAEGHGQEDGADAAGGGSRGSREAGALGVALSIWASWGEEDDIHPVAYEGSGHYPSERGRRCNQTRPARLESASCHVADFASEEDGSGPVSLTPSIAGER
jgi:hypothetical protein